MFWSWTLARNHKADRFLSVVWVREYHPSNGTGTGTPMPTQRRVLKHSKNCSSTLTGRGERAVTKFHSALLGSAGSTLCTSFSSVCTFFLFILEQGALALPSKMLSPFHHLLRQQVNQILGNLSILQVTQVFQPVFPLWNLDSLVIISIFKPLKRLIFFLNQVLLIFLLEKIMCFL